MRRLILFAALVLLTSGVNAQFGIDTIGFHVYRADVFQGQETPGGFLPSKVESYKVDVLFLVEGNRVSTHNLRGQFRDYRFSGTPVYYNDLAHGVPGYEIPSLDRGGFKCVISILQRGENHYRIRIDYSNLRLFFYAMVSERRPSDYDIPDLVRESREWRENPDYTEEEIMDFIRRYREGDEVARTIVQMLIFESILEF